MLFLYVSNIFIKNAFISKTRANSAKIRPFSESAHLIYLETVEISSAKICVLTSVIYLLFTGHTNEAYLLSTHAKLQTKNLTYNAKRETHQQPSQAVQRAV